MKKRLFLTGIIGLGLAFVLILAGCPTDGGDGGGGGGGDTVVTTAGIGGVTAPVTGGTPVTAITPTSQYTGTVSWAPAATTFAASTTYAATITLTAEPGYTFTGVTANFFTVAGATTVTNAADTGVVTAIFPATGTAGTAVTMAAIGGVTAPATGGTPVTAITETAQYTGTVSWAPAVTTTFAASTAYTATITLAAKAGYTFTGVTANFFTVAGATTVTNAADTGVVTAIFPATNAGLRIRPKSMELEVVWDKFEDLATPADYQVRYKANATGVSDVATSLQLPAANITEPITGSFKADITSLINNTPYTVWVFKSSDTYTIASPLYTGTGTPVPPATVTLESKSHGTAAANSITGLEASAKYVVKEGNSWYPIAASGDLGNAGTLDTAVSATVGNVATIGNLSNNNTYNVFLVKVFADNATLGTTDTNSKNTIADVKALDTGKKLTITSTGGGGTLIVFTNEDNAAAIAEKTIGENDQIGSAAKTYKVTEVTNVSTTKIKATAGDKYAEIDLTPMPNGSVIVFEVQ
jgi:CheY-specific phosphatase CheX